MFPDGTWSGNVYDFYRRVIPKLTANLKVPFRLRDDLYRRDETHVHEAVREALVNTLVHADYEGRVSVLVLRTQDGFSFRNPGGPRLPLEQIRRGGVSDCRNRTLQRMFLMLGIGEQAGSGFSRILRAWREQQWQAPVLGEDVALDTTTLRLSMTTLLPPDIVGLLERRFGKEFRELPADGRMALALATSEGSFTHQRLSEVSDSHPRDLTLVLQSLLRKGKLERDRPGRGCTYRLAGASGFERADGGPAAGRDASSDTSSDTSSAVRGAIEAACRGGFRTAAEIADEMGRSTVTVRRHLAALLASGALERRYPDRPRHPRQAYRIATATSREDRV